MCRLRTGGGDKTSEQINTPLGMVTETRTDLSYTRVADEKELEEIVVLAGVHGEGRWRRCCW